jgi:outer membrane protein assembly factor BamD
MKIRLPAYFLLLFLFLLGSCSQYPKILKGNDMKLKLEWAQKLYKEGDYSRAQPLYEQLAIHYRGTSLAEDLHYYNAYCFYGMKDYDMATYLFKRFCEEFGASPRLEECTYMYCYTEYLNSLPANLDQTDTHKCIEDITLFIGQFPDSKYIPQCNNLMDNLRKKLELKAYNTAYLFYKTEEYKASAITFTNLLKDYPDTEFKEEAEYFIIKSYYLYAQNSIEAKKAERFRTVMKSYEEYKTDFTKEYSADALKMYDNSKKQVEKLEGKPAVSTH